MILMILAFCRHAVKEIRSRFMIKMDARSVRNHRMGRLPILWLLTFSEFLAS